MDFYYSHNNILKIVTIKNMEATAKDLRQIIENDLNLETFSILDLGRIVDDDELLSNLTRNRFTIQDYQKR